MVELYIEAWEWHDANIEHLATHGITPEMIEDEIWLEAPKFIANRHNRSASHLMVGPDHGGSLWTVCILQVDAHPGVWRDHWMAKQAARSGLVLEGSMNLKKQHERDTEVARQLERDTEDEAMWEQEPVTIERRPSRTSVLSLRLPTAEFHAMLSAARHAGESVSEYARKAISARVAAELPTTFVTATYTDFVTLQDVRLRQWRTLTAGSAQSAPKESVSSTR